MFVEELKADFYNKLLGHRVLLLVHYDVDAICTCRILQSLFKCDNIAHTLVPVSTVSELKSAYEENSEEIKFAVLVNCGGTVDLVDLLQPDEDVVFFVLDSHKPSDVCNVYSDGQVRLVYKDSEESVPGFDDIFKDDEEDESDSEEPGGEEGREARAAAVLRRRERRAWEERRNTLMFNYTQFTYYGKASACVALELAWRLARAGVAQLWCAAVAAAAHTALALRPQARCLLDMAPDLHQHAARLQHASQHQPHAATVMLEKDAWLPLYRSWSLESAVRHAPALAPHLKLHTLTGENRIRQLLADMGFPLQQARQAYRSMDVALRRELLPALEAASARMSLPEPTRPSFQLRRAFAPLLAALDLVYVIMALLEEEASCPSENFERALSSLSVESDGAMAGVGAAVAARGVRAAQVKLGAVARAVNTALAGRQLRTGGPFNYFLLPEGTPEASALGRPLWLAEAARWAAAHGGPGGSAKPMLVGCAAAGRPDACLLVGVPPRHLEEPRNLLGKAFEQAAEQSRCDLVADYFDTSVVLLPLDQRTKFIDALTALLT